MAVDFIQQEGLATSPDFMAQVNAIVKQQALYKKDTMPDLDQNNLSVLARAAQSPQSFAFAGTIVAADTWDTTFDAWSADLAAAAGIIRAAVDHNFDFLTGFNPTPPPAP